MKTSLTKKASFPLVKQDVKDAAKAALEKCYEDLENGDLVPVETLYDVMEKLFPENGVIPPKQTLEPRVRAQGLNVEYVDDIAVERASGLAYVYRAYNNAYRIFLNPVATENEKKFIDLHEKGHVVYNHLNVEVNRDHFKKVIARDFRKVKDYFSDTTLRKKTEDELVDYLYFKLANIAQDMEINSKQFENDWEVAKTTMSRVSSEVQLGNADTVKKQKQYVAGLLREFEDGENQWFCHPENYPNLWPKMDWMVYMKYLVTNIEDTVQKIAVAAAGELSGGKGEKGDKKSPGKGKIGEDDVNEAKEEEDRGKDSEKDETFPDEEFETDEEFDQGGHSSGGTHNVAIVEPTEVASLADLAQIIQRHSFSFEKRYLRTDVLYNSNRNKHVGIVIPRRHYVRKVYPGAMQFLVDVSGSVNISLVEACIKTIKETISFDKRNSHVVCWDTQLCADFTLDGPIQIPRGGDNKCVRGVEYIIDRYIKRADSKMCFISDGGDYLYEICQAAKKAHCFKYYIEYKYGNQEFFSQDWSRMDKAQQQEFMKVFECFQVDCSDYR